MEERKIPKWLKDLQENSWELELLISGGAIFTLFQLTESFILSIDKFKMISPVLGTDIVFVIISIALKLLTLGFIAHLCLRAYWLALVCINYVYPNGIKLNKIKREKPYKIKVEDGEDLQKQITTVDRYCGSVIFMAITSVFAIAGIIFSFLILVSAFLIGENTLTPESKFNSLFFTFLGIAYLTYLIDFLLFGILRKIPFVSYLTYPLFLFFDAISFRKAYQNSLWIFTTNINKIKFVFVFLLYFSFSVLWAYFSIGKALRWNNIFDQREFLDRLSKNEYVSYKYYMDEWGDYIFLYGISSKKQHTNFMEVFIRYDRHYDDLIHETSKTDSLKSFAKLAKVQINNQSIQNIIWHPTIKKDNFRGITALIPIKQFSDGEYILKLKTSVLSDYSAEIPFWIDRDNIEVNIK